jgi:ferric-dicitrate binding protein FerR (iron transport regulator)
VEFEAEPRRSVLARVAAYNEREIEVSSALDGLALGGQYDLADYEAILDAIETILPVQVLREENGRVRVVPR